MLVKLNPNLSVSTTVYTISACTVSINKINKIIFQTVFIEELNVHSKIILCKKFNKIISHVSESTQIFSHEISFYEKF